MHKRILAVLIVLIAVAACQPAEPTPTTYRSPTSTPAPTTPPQPDATPQPTPEPVVVRVDLGRQPATIDPALVAPLDAPANDLVENLFIGLTRLNPDAGTVGPWLATEWEALDGGRRWVFTLRDDVMWTRIDNQGQMQAVRPVTAGDVAYAVDRACQLGGTIPAAQAVQWVEGCENGMPVVQAVNDVTVEFTLRDAIGFFPNLTAMPVFRPLPGELIADFPDAWSQPTTIWTSGAYTLQPTIPPEEGYTLVANGSWPFAREGNVSVVQISFQEGAFAAWQAGDLAVATIPGDQLTTIPFDEDPRYIRMAQPGITMMSFSYDTYPINFANIRQGFALAVDRERLIEEVLEPNGVTGIPATDIIPPGTTDAPAPIQPTYDPEAARQRFADANFENCVNMPDRLLMTDQSELSRALMTALDDQWEEILGCRENALQLDSAPLQEVLIALRQPVSSRFQVRRAVAISLSWQADYPDTFHYLADIVACREVRFDAYLDNARECIDADGQIAEAAAIFDAQARRTAYGDIVQDFFGPQGEMPVIPIYYWARPLAVAEGVQIAPTLAGPLQFDKWMVDGG